jgi:hypothetical protein
MMAISSLQPSEPKYLLLYSRKAKKRVTLRGFDRFRMEGKIAKNVVGGGPAGQAAKARRCARATAGWNFPRAVRPEAASLVELYVPGRLACRHARQNGFPHRCERRGMGLRRPSSYADSRGAPQRVHDLHEVFKGTAERSLYPLELPVPDLVDFIVNSSPAAYIRRQSVKRRKDICRGVNFLTQFTRTAISKLKEPQLRSAWYRSASLRLALRRSAPRKSAPRSDTMASSSSASAD